MITGHRVLSDRYEVLDFIGEGGMSRVYRGTDRVLGRQVAIKVLSDNLAREEEAVRRFRREAQAVAALNHPLVVAVYDTGSDGDIHYIVMEHLAGRPLDEALREDGSPPAEEALEIAEQVCAALGAAHERGLIHRDIKPANIMLTQDGSLKVMDFGIARAAGDTGTQTATVLGTATYIAPEQARGRSVDARSDLYSLGVVLYEMLTGRPPFAAETAVAVAAKHVEEQPLPPSRIAAGLRREVDAVVLRALAKSPEERFGSAEEFARALRRLRADLAGAVPAADRTERIPAQPTSVLPAVPAPTGTPPESGRGRAYVWVIVALLLVLGVVFALILTGLDDTERPAGQGARPTASPTASPEPTTPPPTTPPPEPVPGVGVAAAALAAEVAEGVEAGDISDKAANDLAKTGTKAVREYNNGNEEAALAEAEAMHGQVDELAAKGEITSPEREDALHEGIDDLVAAIEAG